jgi:predicted RecB family nuclease
MLNVGGTVHLSASDLVGHLNCRYLTNLDLAVANSKLAKPLIWDPVLEVLAERGALHERSYVDHLEANGFAVAAIDGVGVDSSAVAQTLEAMKAGAQIIVQGALQAAHWSGRVDVLRRVEKPSDLGSWSYEVVDTKLARETKGSTVLQICLYSELVAAAQKLVPEFAYVVTPGSDFRPEEFRIADYAAYYRRVKRSLERAITSEDDVASYPDPNPHCDVCRWRLHCEERRRADDHLCLVAHISKSQIGELKRHGITTTADLASSPSRRSLRRGRQRGRIASFDETDGHGGLPRRI